MKTLFHHCKHNLCWKEYLSFPKFICCNPLSMTVIEVGPVGSPYKWDFVCAQSLSCVQLFWTLLEVHVAPMDCSPRGSSVYEIFQARILEWAASSRMNGTSDLINKTPEGPLPLFPPREDTVGSQLSATWKRTLTGL